MSLIDWLFRCPAWSNHQHPLLAFAQPSTEEEQTAHRLAHACRDHKTIKGLACIMSMWDARFGSHSLEMPAHVAFYVSHLLTIGILLFCLLHLIIYPLIHTICSWLLSLVYMPFLVYSASLQYVAGCTLTMN